MILKIVNPYGDIQYKKVKNVIVKKDYIEVHDKETFPNNIYFKDVVSVDLFYGDNVEFIYPK